MVGAVEVDLSRDLLLKARKRLNNQRAVVATSDPNDGPLHSKSRQANFIMQAKLDRLIKQHETLVDEAEKTGFA